VLRSTGGRPTELLAILEHGGYFQLEATDFGAVAIELKNLGKLHDRMTANVRPGSDFVLPDLPSVVEGSSPNWWK
jgi:hypothetical protein